jgi:hypothetical protein
LWAGRRSFRAGASAEAAFHEVGEEQVEGTFDDGAEVSIGEGMSEQVAGELEFLFEGRAAGKLDSVTMGGQGFERARGRWEFGWWRRWR